MANENEYTIIISTCPDKIEADKISEALVEKKIAACVQISEIKSIYSWRGKIESGQEFRLDIKTRAALFDKAEAVIKELSSYDTPEIVSVPIVRGSRKYLGWIDEVTF